MNSGSPFLKSDCNEKDESDPMKVSIEYDEQKNQTNLQKHGMSLRTAAYALNDPNALIEYDEIHSMLVKV